MLLPLSSEDDYKPIVLVAGGPRALKGSIKNRERQAYWRNKVRYIDLSERSPRWVQFQRTMVKSRDVTSAVIMSDGRIFIVAGALNSPTGSKVPGEAEIFDPQGKDWEKAWEVTGSTSIAWTYHSCALLIPDGRIVVGGQESTDPSSGYDRWEIYCPWYYFIRERPVISGVSADIQYGQQFDITIQRPTPQDIDQVLLIHPGAVTHCFDMSQRAVYLKIISRDVDTIKVEAPPNGTIVPPGYYMVVIITREGGNPTGRRIPSEAVFTHLDFGSQGN